SLSVLFFFNDTPTSHISTLSLHDALPISFFRSTEVPVAAHRALVAAIRAHEGNMRAQRPYRQKRRGFRAGNRQRRVSSAFYRPSAQSILVGQAGHGEPVRAFVAEHREELPHSGWCEEKRAFRLR